ncbi:MAG: Ig domain-containing protein [Clostridia bacterium]|nr:Ig domain-containing protein [Clostridia bacterium]
MKKLRKWIALSMLGLLSCALIGCTNTTDDETPEEPDVPSVEEQITSLSLNKATVSLILGDETTVAATYTEQSEKTLSFTSDTPSVATVDQNGKIQAMGVGSAKITAKYGDETAICNVSVETGGFAPVMDFVEMQEETIEAYYSERVNLNVEALFNGKTFNDVDVTYAYSDESVGSVDDNGYFVPNKTGTTIITLVGTWRGQTNALMEKTITVTVKSGAVVTVNGGESEFNLYTMSSHLGETYATSMPFAVSVTEDDGVTPITGAEITVVEGQDLVDYDDGVITAKGKYGTALITVTSSEGASIPYYQEYKVNVLLPDAEDKTGITFNFDAEKGILTTSEAKALFGVSETDTTVLYAIYDGEDLTVAAGRIINMPVDNTPTAKELIISTSTRVLKFNVKAYTKVFSSADDLFYSKDGATYSYFDVSDATRFEPFSDDVETRVINGAYLLNADIDLTGDSRVMYHANPTQGVGNKTESAALTQAGFNGTFDGAGHTITGMTVGKGGVFGHIGCGTVKNVAFKDVEYKLSGAKKQIEYSYVLAQYICGDKNNAATIKDVYISLANIQSAYLDATTVTTANKNHTNSSVLASKASSNVKFENMVVDMSALGEINVVGRSLFMFETQSGSFTDNMKNVYVISNGALLMSYESETVEGVKTFYGIIKDSYNHTGSWESVTDLQLAFIYNTNMIEVKTENITYTTSDQSVYRFDTATAMAEYIENNGVSLLGFTTDYWNTANGIPEWK